MKKLIISSLVTFLSVAAFAQTELKGELVPTRDVYKDEGNRFSSQPQAFYKKNVTPLSFIQYEMEGTRIYEVNHAVPGSEVNFHQDISGGKMLKSATADAKGTVRIETKDAFNPAFAVNLKAKNKSGISGNGALDFAKPQLFVLNSIRAEQTGNSQNILNWEARINFNNAEFTVLRSRAGSSFETVAHVAAKTAGQSAAYSYTDAEGGNATYVIQVVDKAKNAAYSSRKILVGVAPALVQTYPSPVSDQLTIVLNDNAARGEYKILDNAGKVVMTGALNKTSSVISVTRLTKGSYFLKVITADNRTETKQFMKN